MSKEQVLFIDFSEVPDVRVRIIEDTDKKEIKENKIKYPFEIFNSIDVTVTTDKRTFTFNIFNNYTWNGADIPKFFYRIIGSRTSNRFLIASLLHDYLLQFKKYIIRDVLNNQITITEYRRLTSLIFREKLKTQGTNTIKANIMAWTVDVFQHYFNKKQWENLDV